MKCVDCKVRATCEHIFGKAFDIKSCGGWGCEHPVDDVDRAWREDGWSPKVRSSARSALDGFLKRRSGRC